MNSVFLIPACIHITSCSKNENIFLKRMLYGHAYRGPEWKILNNTPFNFIHTDAQKFLFAS